MQKPAGAFGVGKKANEIDGIALEDICISDIQPVVVDPKVRALANLTARCPACGLKETPDSRRGLQLLHFKGAA